jgi:integrase
MSRISGQVEDYIAYKRGLGFKIEVEAAELRRFASFADAAGYDGPVCNAVADAWIASTPGISGKFAGRRMETVATFSRYASVVDAEASVLARTWPSCRSRGEPYIYTESEVVTIMGEMASLHSPDGLRALTAPTVVGLLWATGLRPSEAIRLEDADVDLVGGTILVRGSKFAKSRMIPVNPGVSRRLAAYDLAARSLGKRRGGRFFAWTGGAPVSIRWMEYALQVTRDSILPEGAETWGRRPPRLYDFRHTRASRTIESWLVAGLDVDELMPALSAYLGHTRVEDTYWYLSSTPELLALAAVMRPEGIGTEAHDG